ncbi:hypothetical protein OG474_30400 [Kribbella sp. NBC_01505]|uniref:hypothetical protein n=1 Tax=Kribbella sp. NBC_01505 TaxID=2903580 RepID=UPI00386F2F9E
MRNEYEGKVTTRDEVTADITIFRNSQNVETKTPHEVVKDAVITHTALANEAERNIGQVLLCVVRKVKNYYAFQAVTDPAVEAAAGEYFERRDGELAEAMANVPAFD